MIKGVDGNMCTGGRKGREKKQGSHDAIRLDKVSLNQGERREKRSF